MSCSCSEGILALWDTLDLFLKGTKVYSVYRQVSKENCAPECHVSGRLMTH